jgi:protein gp37
VSGKTSIEWTDATWNPLRGCSRVSEGCRNCYAEKVAARFSVPYGPAGPKYQPGRFANVIRDGKWNGVVELVEGKVAEPLHWRKAKRVFVNSMSDLFHESVPDEWIDRVFAVMALAPQHTFQVLTKRPERMRAYLQCGVGLYDRVLRAAEPLREMFPGLNRIGISNPAAIPLPNVWLGVSVEDQATADERIPLLLQTPAAVRFVSYEPALGPVDFARLRGYLGAGDSVKADLVIDALGGFYAAAWRGRSTTPDTPLPEYARPLDWIIVGGESGPGARPFDVAWAWSTIAQCKAAGVACFVKQLGAHPCDRGPGQSYHHAHGELLCKKLADKKGGDMAEWPEDLRVREFPSVRA